MLNRSQILRNLILATLQAVLSAVVLFLLYRYIIQLVGIEQFGVFSILTASVYFLGIGALGLPTAILRSQARYLALDDEENAVKVIQTGLISLSLIMTVIVLISFPIYRTLIPKLFPSENQVIAFTLLPASLIYILFDSLRRGIIQSLDGCFRVDVRAVLMIIQPFIILIVSLILIPDLGILGYVIARIFGAGFVIISGWLFLKRTFSSLPVLPIFWNAELFIELIKYGLKMQVSGLALYIFEPLAKVFLGLYGDMAIAGYYEVAQKLVFQVRSLLISSSQALISLYTSYQENDLKKLRQTYLININVLQFIAIPAFFGLISVSPFFAELMIGHANDQFIMIICMLSLSYLLNSLSSPSYFVYSATGELKWNVISRLMMMITIIVLGVCLGSLYGSNGVVTAVAIAYGVTPLLTLFAFGKQNMIRLEHISFRVNFLFSLGYALISTCALFFYSKFQISANIIFQLFFFFVLLILFAFLFWQHPQRKIIINMILDLDMIHMNRNEK